jgi:hypothetical protein
LIIAKRSLTKILNKRGPRVDPCGTPDIIIIIVIIVTVINFVVVVVVVAVVVVV